VYLIQLVQCGVPVEDSCEHDNETWGSIKGVIDKLCKHQLLEKKAFTRVQLVS
jgi:hypothetical protein